MPTIEVTKAAFAQYVRQVIETYCNDEHYVDPIKVQALLEEHPGVKASLSEVVDSLFYLKGRGILEVEVLGNPRGVCFKVVR